MSAGVPDIRAGDGWVPAVLPELAPLPDRDELTWADQALCAEVDPEIFFPEKGGSSREAKRICSECSVRIECLNYALRRDERYGVWGGMSERERRRLKRMAS